MKEIKKEITTEQVVYEITKKELETIKRDARNKGRYDIINYLQFSIKYYSYELNFAGMKSLIEDIADFLLGNKNTVPNICEYSFTEYISEYRK